MVASKPQYYAQIRELAILVMAVAGESVTMVKRVAPEKALSLKRRREWEIYLEFLKMLLNVADRMTAMFVPVQEHHLFMDSLVDEIIQQLKATLGPALGQNSDEMELILAIETAVSDSRQTYEPFRFVVTEESKGKEDWYKLFGDRLERLMDLQQSGMVTSTATLCISSVIPAMKALFEGISPQPLAASPSGGPAPTTAGQKAPASPAAAPDPGRSATGHRKAAAESKGGGIGNEIKLLSVVATVEGEEIETRWGLHPRFRQDLKPQQVQEVTRLMNRITQIMGTRYAEVAFSDEWATWRQSGHA